MTKDFVAVAYISNWDDGVEVESSAAKLDLETGKVVDIESIEVSGLDNLNHEDIVVRLGSMTKVIEVVEDKDGDYAISLDDLNIIKSNVANSEEEITWEEFVENYTPIKNPFVNDAPFDGTMFETYGDEVKYVQQEQKARKKCWTLLDEDGKTWIEYGYRLVNRLGYFITEHLPLNPNISVFIEDCSKERLESLMDAIKSTIEESEFGCEPLDGDGVDELASAIRTTISLHEGNKEKEENVLIKELYAIEKDKFSKIEKKYLSQKKKEYLALVLDTLSKQKDEKYIALSKAIKEFSPIECYPQSDICIYNGCRIWCNSFIFKNSDGLEKVVIMNKDGDFDINNVSVSSKSDENIFFVVNGKEFDNEIFEIYSGWDNEIAKKYEIFK